MLDPRSVIFCPFLPSWQAVSQLLRSACSLVLQVCQSVFSSDSEVVRYDSYLLLSDRESGVILAQ